MLHKYVLNSEKTIENIEYHVVGKDSNIYAIAMFFSQNFSQFCLIIYSLCMIY